MPGPHELIGILIVVAVLWFVLKLARVAVRLILFIVAIVLVAGALYLVFVR
jgi:hypothetical protein